MDIWDEIERGLGQYDEDEEIMAGNSKQGSEHSPWAQTIVCGLVVGLVVALVGQGSNRWFSKEAENNDKLTAAVTKLDFVSKQVELLAQRPYITRDEFERELSRLNARVERLEGQGELGIQVQHPGKR